MRGFISLRSYEVAQELLQKVMGNVPRRPYLTEFHCKMSRETITRWLRLQWPRPTCLWSNLWRTWPEGTQPGLQTVARLPGPVRRHRAVGIQTDPNTGPLASYAI